jgi:hypothetical protein
MDALENAQKRMKSGKYLTSTSRYSVKRGSNDREGIAGKGNTCPLQAQRRGKGAQKGRNIEGQPNRQ